MKETTAKKAKALPTDVLDLAIAQDQLNHLRYAQGDPCTEQHGPLWRGIDYLMNLRERRVLQPVQKSTYLKLCWLGALGIHRMYAKQWFTAAVYLATCWTGISIAMTLIDVMAVLPMKADEKGAIYL